MKNMIPEDNAPAAALVRSIGEAASRFQSLALESARRAVEIQFQLIGKAFDTYISQMSRLGRTTFVTSPPLDGQRQKPSDTTQRTEEAQEQSPVVEAPLQRGRRAVAQNLTTKRKTGPVAKSRAASQRSKKGSARRGTRRRAKK